MMGALIEARDMSVGYDKSMVIRDLTLEVNPGEIVALLGSNGAGKSTTLLTLAGELRPAQGKVLWNGTESTASLHRRARQGLAFVTEERSVFSHLTARQNLAVARDCDVSKVVELFPELGSILHRRASVLSGGEQQMLTVGRALARPTKLLLADEISLGLAPRTATRLLQAVRAAADEQGIGALVVEQHIHRVLEVADRVYVLRNGRLVLSLTAKEASGRLDDIQDHYLATHAGVADDEL